MYLKERQPSSSLPLLPSLIASAHFNHADNKMHSFTKLLSAYLYYTRILYAHQVSKTNKTSSVYNLSSCFGKPS